MVVQYFHQFNLLGKRVVPDLIMWLYAYCFRPSSQLDLL